MEKILKLYRYIDGVNDEPFPSNEGQVIATSFRYDAKRMGGAPTINFSFMHNVCLDDLWDDKVYATFNEEKFFLKQTPTSSYSNTDARYKHEVDLVSERVVLDNVYFYDVVSSSYSDKPVSNSAKFSFFGDIEEYVTRLNHSLTKSNLDYRIVIDSGVASSEELVSLENQVITSALQEIYNIYKIPYYFVGKTIHVGEYDDKIDVVFKYGVDNSLLSISKSNANAKIINRITGVGSQDNIPYYYPNDDEKGITRALYNGSPSGATIVNASKYRKVRLSDTFKFYDTIQTYVPLIDSSVYNFGDLRNDGAQDNKSKYSIDFYYSFTLSQQENVQISVTTEYEDNVDLKFEVFKTSGQHLGYFVGDSSLSLTGGTYNLIVRWTFLSDIPTGGIYEYVPSLISQHLNISANIAVDSTETWTLKDIPVSLSDYGLSVSQQSNGDIISFERVSYIQPQPNLMPPIYRESLDVFYNALNNTYKDSNGDYYVFDNEYTPNNPKEHIENFDDIKPTIKNVVNANGERIDRFVAFAYDLEDNDETDENGNYLHPYFFAKLRKFNGSFGFNLFDHSIDESEMVVSMTSGTCGSCEFVIGVDSNTQKNTVQVDSNGNLLRDNNGNVRFGSPQDRQNDTENYEVWVALKKDINTFGVIMPNASENYKPIAGDTFVILHIDLPKPYVNAAEAKLEQELLKYMQENNFEKFNFSISFSRIYFSENPSVLKNLTENSSLKIEYNSHVYDLYVSSLSYSMSNDSPLPEIKVELQDAISISQNQLQQVVTSTKREILSSIDTDVFWSNIKGIPSWITSEKPRYSFSELSGIVEASDNVWTLKSTDDGKFYIYTIYPVITQQGITTYSEPDGLDLPSIYNGLPIDNQTLYWEETTNDDGSITRILKARGGSSGDGIVGQVTWDNITGKPTWLEDGKIYFNEIEGAPNMSLYATQEWVTELINNSGGGGGGTDSGSLSVSSSGDGNAFTSYTYINGTLTLFKDSTFALQTDYRSLSQTVGTLQSSFSDMVMALGKKLDASEFETWKSDNESLIANGNTAYGWGNHADAGYATEEWVTGKGYLTSHQTIYNLTMKSGAFSATTFDPNGAAKTVNIPTSTDHLTEGSNLFFTEERVTNALGNTLSNYVDLTSSQTITGKKDFTTGGLFVNGKQIKYNSAGYWMLEGDLLVTGGITSFASDTAFTPSTIMDALVLDSSTLKINDEGQLTVIGGTGGTADSVAWGDITGKPSWIGSSKPSYSWTEITSKPSWIGSTKPSYSYSEITGTPTTLKNPYALTFGTKTYDGSSAKTILASDLGALTSHQTIYSLTIATGSASTGTYTPNSAAKTIYIPKTTSHISEGDKLFFTEQRAIDALADTLTNYVNLGSEQSISGKKHFNGGLTIGGGEIEYNADGYWKLNGNLLVTGGITAYSTDGEESPFILDADTIDLITSESTTQVYTARATKLIKDEVISVGIDASAALAKLATIKSELASITDTSLISVIRDVLINIREKI